jgi:hypothetical protein
MTFNVQFVTPCETVMSVQISKKYFLFSCYEFCNSYFENNRTETSSYEHIYVEWSTTIMRSFLTFDTYFLFVCCTFVFQLDFFDTNFYTGG